ncbi:MAG: zinc-finger domain-containing protein [Betaproteobacteria bacterium]
MSNKQKQVEVTAADMPLHCPLASQKLWDSHPRVFLPIGDDGTALCPYCATRYILRGAVEASH